MEKGWRLHALVCASIVLASSAIALTHNACSSRIEIKYLQIRLKHYSRLSPDSARASVRQYRMRQRKGP
jgi:hypothetical protein